MPPTPENGKPHLNFFAAAAGKNLFPAAAPDKLSQWML
jgi:hypothetical protein